MAPRSLNKVLLIGNLGKDPEVRYTGAGRAVASFTLATSWRWKDQDGNDQERTEWHRIVAWGPLADICGQYLSKGKQVFIEGRIQSRDWEDADGNRRTTVEIVATDMIMLGGGGTAQGEPREQREARQSPPRRQEPARPAAKRDGQSYEPPPPEDDIPF